MSQKHIIDTPAVEDLVVVNTDPKLPAVISEEQASQDPPPCNNVLFEYRGKLYRFKSIEDKADALEHFVQGQSSNFEKFRRLYFLPQSKEEDKLGYATIRDHYKEVHAEAEQYFEEVATLLQ